MKFAKNLAYFSLGFVLFLLLRRAIVPPVPGPLERDTAPLIAERASCTVLFLGPSYVDNQVFPDAFDEEAARIGLKAHACKYGTTALRGYELRMWIERFLAYDWPRLELVVIDITLGDKIGFDPGNWLKPRVVEWHTWDAVPWLLDYYEYRERLPLGQKLQALFAHGKHVGAHYLEVGNGVEALGAFRVLERLRPPPDVELTRRRSGTRTRGKKPQGAAYESHIQAMIEKRRTRGPRPGRNDWALELRSVVRAHGKEAYFLLAPVLYSPQLPKQLKKDPLVVFNFNDPARYPELYVENVRGNTSHLRNQGGILYSQLLARELKAVQRPRRRR